MKQYLLLLLSFTIVTYTTAQKGFVPGSITLNANETLEGKIDVNKNPGEAKELRFSKDGSVQTYSISDVKGNTSIIIKVLLILNMQPSFLMAPW